jgi:hypothetical protein
VAISRTTDEFHALFEDEELEILDVRHLNEGRNRFFYQQCFKN